MVIPGLKVQMGRGGQQIRIFGVGGNDVLQRQRRPLHPLCAHSGLSIKQPATGRIRAGIRFGIRPEVRVRPRPPGTVGRRPKPAVLDMRWHKAAPGRNAFKHHAARVIQIIIADRLIPARRVGQRIGQVAVPPTVRCRHAQMIQVKPGFPDRQPGIIAIPTAMQGRRRGRPGHPDRKQAYLRLAPPDPINPVNIGAEHFPQGKAPQRLTAGGRHGGDLVFQAGFKPFIRINRQNPGRPHGPRGSQQPVATVGFRAEGQGRRPVIPTDPAMRNRRDVFQKRRHQSGLVPIGKYRNDHRFAGGRTARQARS